MSHLPKLVFYQTVSDSKLLLSGTETSVTVTNSSFQNYTHPDDHTTGTTDTPGFKPFTINKKIVTMNSGNLPLRNCGQNKMEIFYFNRNSSSNTSLYNMDFNHFMYPVEIPQILDTQLQDNDFDNSFVAFFTALKTATWDCNCPQCRPSSH